jgi:hypothetical protein
MNQPEPTTDTTHTRRTTASTTRRAERGERQSRTGVLPPVPLSVWLAAPLTGCCPTCEHPTSAACAQRLPQGLARQITDAYSRSGEVVFVPDAGNGTLLLAAARTGRKVLGLVRGSDHGRRTQQLFADQDPDTASRVIIRSAPGPAALAAQAARIAGRAALTVLAPHDPVSPPALGALLDSARTALRHGGVAVICARPTPGQDSAGTLTAYAQAAGFTYLQHIAAVEAPAHKNRLLPLPESATHGPDCTCTNPAPGGGAHRLAHHDLLVFQRP